jgi:hypothetical protein
MRIYSVEDLEPDQIQRVEHNLQSKGLAGSLDGIYWLPLPESLLSSEQEEHTEKCGPHCMALESGDGWLRMELLVRSRANLRCSCIAYATPGQREHMIEYLDSLLRELDIPV